MLRHDVRQCQPRGRVGDGLLQIAGIVLGLAVIAPAMAGTWIEHGSLLTPRARTNVALLPNGLVLVAGGEGTAGALSSAELYDPTTGKFASTGSMASAREYATATVLNNGQVLIAGGSNETSDLASAEIYDPASGTFSVTGSMAAARSRATATLLADGRVLVAAGLSGPTAQASAEIYDSTTGQFASTGPLQTARFFGAATLLSDGRALVAGGQQSNSSSVASTEIFDPVTAQFTAGAALTIARTSATATLLADGTVLIAGGFAFNGIQSQILGSAEVYDPVGGKSTATGAMSNARFGAIASRLPSGSVMIAGGNSSIFSEVALASAEIYNPASATFSPTASMANARDQASAVLLPNSRTLAIGGLTSGGYVAQAEVYDGSTPTFTPTGSLLECSDGIASALPDGRVLLTACSFPDFGQLYDPATGTFSLSNGATINDPRQGSTLTLLGNGQALLAGGFNAGTAAEQFDPVTGTYSVVGSMSVTRTNHTATLLANGQVLIAGGIDVAGGSERLQSTEVYDPATQTFGQESFMTIARVYAMATLLPSGKVLIAGGIIDDASTTTNHADLCSPPSACISTGPMNFARYRATSTLLPDGNVLVAGGENTVDGLIAPAELYNPAIGTFSTTGSLANPRILATATLLANGTVMIAGGFDAGGYTTSVEIYDPATGLFGPGPSLTAARGQATATALQNGKVLIAGGITTNSNNTTVSVLSAELYDPGNGFTDLGRPQIDSVGISSPFQPLTLNIGGAGFRASTQETSGAIGAEASGGGVQSAATNFPLLQLRRVDNAQQFYVSAGQAWTDSSFVTSTLLGLPLGYYWATVYVNGIPSEAKLISLAPALTVTVIGGDPQTATVATPFAQPLQAIVTDPDHNPVRRVPVSFVCVPASNGACIAPAGVQITDAQGMVSTAIAANTAAGSYTVQVIAGGSNTPATVHLSNATGPAAILTAIGGQVQSTQVGTVFPKPLQALLTDQFNNPVFNVSVRFLVPTSGASTQFVLQSATTNMQGVATLTATANTIAGSFTATAFFDPLSAPSFSLTNTAGPAARIAAQNGPAFTGTAGLPLGTSPTVAVGDAFGNPVSGVAVTFAAGADSGSIDDENALTDSTGTATPGNWTLAADPGTNTLTASVAGLTGSPVQFTAVGTANVDVAVTMTNNRGFVQFGHTLDYVIVVTAAGPSNAHNVQVTDMLPFQLDAANAHWVCIPAINASCNASGTGNLVNETADVPSGGSVTYVLSATVLDDQQILDNTIVNTVSITADGDTDSSNNSVTVTTQAVIFRNSFEPGGDGSH
jgi:uncharacterized repeat protein (TIGR01451 family)